ncbi:MAG: DUF308 domain-containing protein [Clostridia bacterium]
MKKPSLAFSWTSGSISAIAFYAICGVLLLLLPNIALAVANYALAVILLIIGVVCIVNYFRLSILDAALGFGFAIGLVSACFGLLLCVQPNLLKMLLPFLWGVSMLVGGFGKVQMSIDLKRFKESAWWIPLAGSAVSFVLGVLAIFNSQQFAAATVQFIGVSLLVEAMLDGASLFVVRKKIKAYRKAVNQTMDTVEV